MRPNRPRYSRAVLKDILDGRSTAHDALTNLIDAARLPGTELSERELGAAMSAFAVASHTPEFNEAHRRPSMLKSLTAKLLAAKLAAVAGAAAIGGVAVAAAATGNLPDPLPHASHAGGAASSHHAATASAIAVSASATASSTATGSATATESSSAATASASSAKTSHPHPSHIPSPSLHGLCNAWLARDHDHGKADDSSAFSVLITTAGGKASVNSYCTALLSTATPTPSPSASEDPSDSTGKPTAAPGNPSHSTGKPTASPTPSPTPSASI
jgi:hypothetical protein